MNTDLFELKNKLEKVIDILDTYPPDTIPSRIKERRIAIGAFKREIDRIRKIVAPYPQPVKDFLEELITLFKDYYFYFDEGYQCNKKPEEVEALLRDKLDKALERINQL